MGKQTLIKKEFLEQLGFRPVSYMNIMTIPIREY